MSLYKELSYESAITPVKSIQFALLSPDEIVKRSVCKITSSETFDASIQKPNGMFDQRMGVVEHGKFCQTCGQGYTFCPGHHGHIELAVPVFHFHFFKDVLKVLKCVCFRCSRLLIGPDEPEMVALRRFHKQKRWEAVYKLITKTSTIKRCGQHNPHGCGALQPTRTSKHDEKFLKVEHEMSWDGVEVSEGEPKPGKITLGAEDVLRILQRIPDEDIIAMGFHPKYSRPEWMIAAVLPIPPPAVRPSAKNEMGQRSEDDLTVVLINIVKTNNSLLQKQASGKSIDNDPQIQLLQYYVATMVDNQIPNTSPATQRTGRSIKSLSERLKTKEGRVRGNLLGKRVDYSARSVITPDPNISINELGVPLRVAMNLTFPETVNSYNRVRLLDAVRNGPNNYPGARFIQKCGKDTLMLRDGKPPPDIALGDIVHRHLRDGDYVLFNRQPSLHKMSMMAHRVRVMPYSTFRLNACVTPSFNADFDGDEMNLHATISAFTMTEIAMLAAVPMHVLSPKNSSPIVAVVQDVAVGVHLISLPDVVIDERTMNNLMATIPRFNGEVPEPLAPGGRWTGKQALSAVVPAPVNVSMKSPNGKPIHIRHGTISEESDALATSTYQKRTVGLVHSVYNEHGPRALTDMLDGTQRLVCDWLMNTGFSVGLSDLVVSGETMNTITEKLDDTVSKVQEVIDAMHKRDWKPKVSLNSPDEDFEDNVNMLLNKARDEAAETAMLKIPASNRIKRMITAGSKGKDLNLAQMTATLGQVNVDLKRPGYGFEGRTLPHYTKFDDGAYARGFVNSSFARGLKPSEFLFHCMGGRVGLIDTAVRTSESGYISRKLVKAMEDCKIATDGTVRNALGQIVQVLYGEDGMDAVSIEDQTMFNLNYDGQKMADEFLIAEGEVPDEWLTEKAASEWKRNPQWERFAEHFRQLMDDRACIVMFMNGGNKDIEKDRTVQFPVNLQRIINDALENQRLAAPRGWPSDLDPREVIDAIDDAVSSLTAHPYMDQAPVFSALLRSYLSPKRLLREGMFKKTFEDIVYKIRERFDDSVAQIGDMIGIVSAQSLGEPTTQLTLNSVTYDTEVLVKDGGAIRVAKIGEIIDPHLPSVQDPLTQTDVAAVGSIECVGISPYEKVKWAGVTHVSRHPSHDALITVTTKSGRRVTATKSHSFLTRKNNRVVPTVGGDLNVGDAVPIVKNLPTPEASVPDCPIPLTFNTGRFVGAVVSEGCVITDKSRINGGIVFSQNDERWVADIVSGFNRDTGLAAKVFSSADRFKVPNNSPVIFHGRLNDARMTRWVASNFGLKSHYKTLPPWVLSAPEEFLRGVLQAMYDGDGSVREAREHHGGSITYCTVSDDLATMTSMALARFGIPTYSRKHTATNCACNSLLVPTSEAAAFQRLVGFGLEKKMSTLQKLVAANSGCSGLHKAVPGVSSVMAALLPVARSNSADKTTIRNILHGKHTDALAPRTIRSIYDKAVGWDADQGLLRELEQMVFAGCFWDPIVDIQETPARGAMVYDFTVDTELQSFMCASLLAVHNTFHMAGVASGSKAVSGLPRVMELLNVTSNPKQSLIHVYLPEDLRFNHEAATKLKPRIETTYLSDVVIQSKVYYDPDDWNTNIPEDRELIESYRIFDSERSPGASPWIIRLELHREIMLSHGLSMMDVSDAINNFYKDAAVTMHGDDNSSELIFRIRLVPQGSATGDLLTEVRAFETAMMESVSLKGNIGVRTALPLRLKGAKEYEFDAALGAFTRVSENDEWIIECDGKDLTEVLASPLVDSKRTQSNDVCETLRVLGVEAARKKLYDELQEVLKDSHINPRHVLLLVDTMTLGGGLQSINRHGINRGDIGPLAKCSFEETTDMLTNAAVFAEVDRVNGVSASIMLGQVPPGGTGETDPILDETLLSESILVNHPLPTDDDGARVDRDEMCRRIMRFAPVDMQANDGWNEEVFLKLKIVK